VSEAARFALSEIYRNLIAAAARALERFDDPIESAAAVEAYSRYHLAGLKALFEAEE
jgi:hypothetical protein